MSGLEKVLEEIEAERADVNDSFSATGRMLDRHWNNCLDAVADIIKKHMNDGWIPVDEQLPEEPKENPVFDDKPLELYLVDMGGSYPLRAFWNGKQFTDGWSVLNVIAWRPLPEPYCPDRSDNHDGE